MKQNKFSAAAVCGLAAVMTLQVSAAAWGATPRFGRSEEEWDRLEDNVLEYGEIEDLIHEYNVTVQNNLQQWNRDDKGKSMEDYVDWYQQSADDFYNQAAEAENEIASIGMEMQGRQAELSAQQAADAASDGETRRLSYELEEKKLAKQAQQIMNDWYQKQQTLIVQQKNWELLEAALASAQSRQSIGAATQAEVLSAQQNLQNGEAQITALKSQIGGSDYGSEKPDRADQAADDCYARLESDQYAGDPPHAGAGPGPHRRHGCGRRYGEGICE